MFFFYKCHDLDHHDHPYHNHPHDHHHHGENLCQESCVKSRARKSPMGKERQTLFKSLQLYHHRHHRHHHHWHHHRHHHYHLHHRHHCHHRPHHQSHHWIGVKSWRTLGWLVLWCFCVFLAQRGLKWCIFGRPRGWPLLVIWRAKPNPGQIATRG